MCKSALTGSLFSVKAWEDDLYKKNGKVRNVQANCILQTKEKFESLLLSISKEMLTNDNMDDF